MNKMNSAVTFGGLVAILLLQCAAGQTQHIVGDSLNWTIPQNGASAYETWAKNNKFVVGDTLMFNFKTNEHDVAEVAKESYDSCSSENPIVLMKSGPANISLNSTGNHYYICTFGQHCQMGQKLTIAVTDSSAPSPMNDVPPPPPPPPSPNSSAAAVFAAFLLPFSWVWSFRFG